MLANALYFYKKLREPKGEKSDKRYIEDQGYYTRVKKIIDALLWHIVKIIDDLREYDSIKIVE